MSANLVAESSSLNNQSHIQQHNQQFQQQQQQQTHHMNSVNSSSHLQAPPSQPPSHLAPNQFSGSSLQQNLNIQMNQMPPPQMNNFIYPWMRPAGNVKQSK
jgi:hypothetical protein